MPRKRRQRSRVSSTSSTDSSSSSTESDQHQRKKKRCCKASRTVSQNVVLASVIPEFDPLVDNIDMWLNVVQSNARAFGWSDNMIKYQALQKLRNSAKMWLDSLQKNETKWTTWKWKHWRNTLSDTFQATRNKFRSLKELIDARPSVNQSLYEFYFEQKGKIDRLQLGFRDRDIIFIIVGSIGDTNISVVAEAGNFRYCDDLASFLHNKTHTLMGKDVPQRNLATSRSNFRSQQPVSVVKSETIVSDSNVATTSNIRRCYRCGDVKHVKSNCPIKSSVICSVCKRTNHTEAVCQWNPNRNVGKDTEVKMINNLQSKRKFFKQILLNHINCEAFFDMGSDCSLITTDLMTKLNLKSFSLSSPINLVGFTSDSSVKVTEAVTATICVDSVELVITLYVISSLSGCDILIGRNFTEDGRLMYVRVGDTLTFQSVQALNVCKVNVASNVLSDHETILSNMLLKYPQSFLEDLSYLGKTSCVELEILLTTNKPIYQRPYRMSESEKAITREITDDLLKNGIIRNSISSYASPALLVNKASGAKRLCVDYRQLNKITVKEKYPMPLIEDLIDRLQGCKCYSSLDLKSGYHQICVKAEDVHKTAFITNDGHFEYLRMPFGLCNGPAIFQRLMNTVLGNLRFGNVICYMDDLRRVLKKICYV